MRRTWFVGAVLALVGSVSLSNVRADAQQPVPASAADSLLARHVRAIATQGQEPLAFVLGALRTHDLIIFDDALHNLQEPFDFYRRLIANDDFRRMAPTIFVELLPSNRQPAIDAYLATPREDPTLLFPAFQDDLGLPYQTYFELLKAVHDANRGLPAERRIKVRAVSTPAMWGEIHTQAEWEQQVEMKPLGRDYFMYALILDGLDRFRSGRKGIFLTNTRHAYTGLKRADGEVFQTTAAFFRLWHPGRSYSIRFNAPVLHVLARRDSAGPRTAEGMESVSYSWARMADGLWDEALAASGSAPVALSLGDGPFGEAPYRGNLMLAAAPGQKMRDAYDALILLGDAASLHRTAINGAVYTPEFRRELRRRYAVIYTPAQLTELLRDEGAASLDALIEASARSAPQQPLPQARALGPVNAWRARATTPDGR